MYILNSLKRFRMKAESSESIGPRKTAAKINLKCTPEIRLAFDKLIYKESFIQSSETILKYVTAESQSEVTS